MFTVPDRFNRNAPEVRAMAPAADTGADLLRYMSERVGLVDLSASDVLDFGCGSRFADAIVNRGVPVRSYVGVDVDQPMIEFLRVNVGDSRLAFHHIDVRSPIYNAAGRLLTMHDRLPLAENAFDVVCMFSVITHQLPFDALAIFAMLRRHVRASGAMFFSAFIDADTDGYREVYPERPTHLSAYSPALLGELLARSGWRQESVMDRNDRDLPILESLVCRPV
jgi:SAM-dependent methyltransferase